ncbi:MAG: GIY-YIG nuclease family protein [Gammaproteobacteria bacterium]|jgi:putative endonuclease|nr:GIY-YIG nuclease family protein [Gammaproteobacteria bacterium]
MNGVEKQWYLYIVRSGDGSLYTGITLDVSRRFDEHRGVGGATYKGAKSLRGKEPLSLVFQQIVGNRSRASQFEYKVKKLRRIEKEALVDKTLALESL